MGWLQRLFGMEKPADAQVNPEPASSPQASSPQTSAPDDTTEETVSPERMGLNGEYDQNGLAKRVALAFDEDSSLEDIDTLYVAQTGTTVVLKGSIPSQEILDQMMEIAQGVSGATDVNTDQVTVG